MKARSFWVLLGLLASLAAPAAADYVCAVTYDPNQPGEGLISFTLNNRPNCRGQQTGIKRFCTAGVNNVGCAVNVSVSEAALLAIYSNAARAVGANLQVSGQVANCRDGQATNCWSNFSLLAR